MSADSPALYAVQRDFARALRARENEPAALAHIDLPPQQALERLRIYRGNAVANAHKALQLAYPVVQQIVGEACFAALTRRYWSDTASTHGDLNLYGAEFADFLDAFEPMRELPYLPDTARLEWRVHQAASATDHRPLEVRMMARLNAERLSSTRLLLQPGLSLLASPWPVADIWLQHQPEHGGDIDIDLQQPAYAVVFRRGLRVEVAPLGAADHLFWLHARAGDTVEDMLAAALQADPAFDAGTALAAGFEREFIETLVPPRTRT